MPFDLIRPLVSQIQSYQKEPPARARPQDYNNENHSSSKGKRGGYRHARGGHKEGAKRASGGSEESKTIPGGGKRKSGSSKTSSSGFGGGAPKRDLGGGGFGGVGIGMMPL